MSWLRAKEGREIKPPESKQKNDIEKTSEKVTPEAKNKLGFERFQDKSPEEQRKSLESQKKFVDERQKLECPQKPNEGNPSKGQRQLERGRETEFE